MTRPSPRGAGIALLALTAIVLAGCGDGADDVSAPPATELTGAAEQAGSEGGVAPASCPITAEQVTTVLGLDMAPSGAGCSFVASGSTFAEVHYSGVSLDVFAADESTAVDGVGDEAYLGPSDELYVRAGDLGFSVHVLVSEIDTGLDGVAAQIELAQLVVNDAG